ncbi:MAG: hypothetical protein IJ662_01025 [Clostridia bacterium]|nr:hypothetical protein [Clostridia bacterium]
MISLPRLRRWMMLGVPAWLAAALTGIPWLPPVALLLWMALGVWIGRSGAALHPRKKRPILHRLFFSWAAAGLTLTLPSALLQRWAGDLSPVTAHLISAGSSCLAAVASERALTIRFPPRIGWTAGILLTIGIYWLFR